MKPAFLDRLADSASLTQESRPGLVEYLREGLAASELQEGQLVLDRVATRLREGVPIEQIYLEAKVNVENRRGTRLLELTREYGKTS